MTSSATKRSGVARFQLHKAIEGAKFGGAGAGVSPDTAPGAGLKVYSAAHYHDGRYPNLMSVVDHYNGCFNLGLS